MLRVTVELLPHGDEQAAHVVARGKVCNLRRHEAGSPLGDYHAYFEANEPPMASELPPYSPNDSRATWHTVGSSVIEDFPRFEGSVWDLICTTLQASGRGRPDESTEYAVSAASVQEGLN